jgi:diaminopimelate epimerase
MKPNNIILFTKMSGSNNDFIIVDNRRNSINQRATLARSVCQRRISVGADGLILVEKSEKADFRMRIFNPDGSEAEMCGNGARCAALYGSNRLFRQPRKTLLIETKAGILKAWIIGKDTVKIKMSQPKDIRINFSLKVGKHAHNVSYINTGVPHAVIWVKDIDKTDVCSLGKKIRYHSCFYPQGTNVNFIKIKDKNSIYIRTYERGVEDETLACGTGSVASAIMAGITKGFKSPVSVYTRGKEILKIYFTKDDETIQDVYLEGKVKFVFEGQITI